MSFSDNSHEIPRIICGGKKKRMSSAAILLGTLGCYEAWHVVTFRNIFLYDVSQKNGY